ncbi:MAG: 3-dehydroquinate synthase [Sandaracinus sp.]|nr:3-dehydroquinate synthase [Sandaracinus sp.]
MRVFLSGPMGVGKSTVARRVAQRLGLRAVDLDAHIEAKAGCSIPEIFARHGEPTFRAWEHELATALVDEDDVVVALGGGTVTDARTRRVLLAAGVLVTLDAPLETLMARVGEGSGRPLLEGDAAARLRTVLDARRAAYAECHARVDATGDVERIADAVVAWVREEPVAVPLGERSYAVEIAAGCRSRLEARTANHPARVLVADRNTAIYLPASVSERDAVVVLEPGEEHKDVRAVERIWDGGLSLGGDRNACVVAIGGGVVGDLAGFGAATLLRGVGFGQVPTSLLAMVDSSVGGKTGFDRPEGKNLVGAFHQPRFVLCDVETLRTLPVEERIAGLAEVVKSAWLEGEADVAALEQDAEALRSGDEGATERAIRRSVRTKARVVAADEREGGARMCLNLGHTVGHAIEAAAGFGELRHGEAVALGMVASFRIATRLGDSDAAAEARLVALLTRLGLPTELERHLDARALSFVATDKKRAGARVRFVVPGAPGAYRIVPLGIDEVGRMLTSGSP